MAAPTLTPRPITATLVESDIGRRAGLALVWVLLIILGSIRPGAEGGAALVDGVLVIAGLHALVGLYTGTRLRDVDRVFVGGLFGAWIYLLVATAYSLMPDAYPLKLLADTVSLSYLLVLLLLLSRIDLVRRQVVWHWLVIASLILLITVLLDPAVRPAGWMANPNLTGTWFGVALLALIATGYPVGSPARSLVLLAPALGLFLSQSYSAWLGFAAGLAYLTVRLRALWVKVLAVVVVSTVALFWQTLLTHLPITDRTERSSSGRFGIWSIAIDTWQQHPWGVGYGAFARTFLTHETHNDYLALLVETGILGVIAWITLLAILAWRAGPAGRSVVGFIAINAAFHNIINYRHLWICLALVLAWEAWQRQHPNGLRALGSPGARKSV